MKYYFSSPAACWEPLKAVGAKNYLLSFAVDAKGSLHRFDDEENSIIIDSGAFTVWNKGSGEIDIDEYLAFLNNIDHPVVGVNLDVIPQTGSTHKEVHECVEKSFDNFLYLKRKSRHQILPVYHYGEDFSVLERYMKETDYIGISPANDTHENVKRKFLGQVFKVCGTKVKTHGLGYSAYQGLFMFPFYSIDSISYKRIQVTIDGQKYGFFTSKQLGYMQEQNIIKYMQIEKDVTEIWKRRGISWD